MKSKCVITFSGLSDKVRSLACNVSSTSSSSSSTSSSSTSSSTTTSSSEVSNVQTKIAKVYAGTQQVQELDIISMKQTGTSHGINQKTSSSIYSLLHVASKGMVIAGRHNGTIDLIDTRNLNIIGTLKDGHIDVVRSLNIYEHILFSGSYDGTVQCWDLTRNQKISSHNPSLSLHKHKGYVNSIQLDVSEGESGSIQYVFTASADGITVFPTKDSSQGFHLIATADEVVAMQKKGKQLFCGLKDSSVRVFSCPIENCGSAVKQEVKPVHTMFPSHQTTVTCMHQSSSYIYSASSDKMVKIWDPEYYFHVMDIQTDHLQPIRSIHAINDQFLVTGGQDHQVKLHKLMK